MIWNVSSRPFSFSTISGCAVVIDRFAASRRADVGNEQAERRRLAGNSFLRVERVLADHVLLQKVVQLQAGLRIDRDRSGINWHRHFLSGAGFDIAESPFDVIDGGPITCGGIGGDKGVLHGPLASGGEHTRAVDGGQAGQRRGFGEEGIADGIAVDVGELELHLHVRQRTDSLLAISSARKTPIASA